MHNLQLDFYKNLYLIRKSEEKIVEHYFDNDMKTPMHMSMGAEAIAVGVCSVLKKDDQVFGSYRSHALYLAKTLNTDDFFAEMYGKETSLIKGKGGSMHLCDPRNGFMGTSAIVASIIPVAVGAAFANLQKNNKKIVAVFFGDGAIDEGAFWESINVACLMKLPIIFICEDNGYAVHSPVSARHGYESISNIIREFHCRVFSNSTTDVHEIYDVTNKAVKHIETNHQPCFLHLKYYRYLEHVGVNEDFKEGYRSSNEYEKWKRKDPILLQRNRLKDIGITEDAVVVLENEIDKKICESIKKAQSAPLPNEAVLYEEVT